MILDSSLPTDRDGIRDWLAAREEAAAGLTRTNLRKIVRAAYQEFTASLTAAGDLGALDAIPSRWMTFVDGKLAPELGETYLAGTMTAWVGLKRQPSAKFAETWAAVVNDNAVSYMRNATNRLAGVGNETWRHIRNQVTRGLQQGLTGEQLKGKIEDLTRFSEFRADTIARTETIGAYVQGDMGGARALGDVGPLEKVWVAARDARTRPSHAAAHNQTRKLAEAFAVGGVSMDAPHAPGAPAGEVVNCRCYVEMLYEGDTRPDGAKVTGRVAPPPPPKPVAKKPPPAKKAAATKPAPTPKPLPPPGDEQLEYWVENKGMSIVRETAGKITPGEMERSERLVREIGARVDREVRAVVERKLADIRPEYERATKHLNELNNLKAERTTQFQRLVTARAKKDGYDDWTVWWADLNSDRKVKASMQALRREFPQDSLNNIRRLRTLFENEDGVYAGLSRKLRYLEAVGSDRDMAVLLRRYSTEFRDLYRDELRATLERIRPMGGTFTQGANAYPGLRPADQPAAALVKGEVERALSYYPVDWIDNSGFEWGKVWVGKAEEGSRSWSSSGLNPAIHLGRIKEFDVTVHEVAHQMEDSNPFIKWHEAQFRKRRAAESGDLRTVRLAELYPGHGYRDSEVTFSDEFESKYIGKVYGGMDANSEVLAMGYGQGVVGGQFQDDLDLLHFVIGLVAAA